MGVLGTTLLYGTGCVQGVRLGWGRSGQVSGLCECVFPWWTSPRPEGLPLSPSQAPILPVSSELLMGQVGNGDPPPLLGVMNTTQLDGNCS